MTKRLLVVLDSDHDTTVATRYAIEIASAHDGAVTGLALVDRKRINAAAKGSGIGGYAFAEKLRKDLAEEVRDEAQVLLHRFVAEAEAAGVRHTDDHVAEDDVVRAITEDMKTHDLLVAGHESHFYYADPDRPTHALAEIVQHGAAATLVVEPAYRPVRRVLVAYDGGLPAARTLQKFVHLSPFGTDVALELIHAHGGGQTAALESERLLRGARAYVEAYGYHDVAGTSVEDDAPASRILRHAADSVADLIVAGAYSASGLKKLLTGSTARDLIEESPIPLFLYH